MNFQNSSFLVFLTRRGNERIESTCHVFICVAESQFGNICYTGVVFYTRSVKGGNFCRIRCQLSVHYGISVQLQFRGASRDETFAEGTSSTRVPWCFFPLLSRKEAASCSLQKETVRVFSVCI